MKMLLVILTVLHLVLLLHMVQVWAPTPCGAGFTSRRSMLKHALACLIRESIYHLPLSYMPQVGCFYSDSIDEKDIEQVCIKTGFSKADACAALYRANFDVINAIYYLRLHPKGPPTHSPYDEADEACGWKLAKNLYDACVVHAFKLAFRIKNLCHGVIFNCECDARDSRESSRTRDFIAAGGLDTLLYITVYLLERSEEGDEEAAGFAVRALQEALGHSSTENRKTLLNTSGTSTTIERLDKIMEGRGGEIVKSWMCARKILALS